MGIHAGPDSHEPVFSAAVIERVLPGLRRVLHPSFFRGMIRCRLFVSFEDAGTEIFFFTGFECKKEAVSVILADIGKNALH